MQDLSLFNIGFSCEAICEALLKYESNGVLLTPRMLEESMQVIENCFSFKGNTASFFSRNRANLSEFLPLVFDLFPNMPSEKIEEKLHNVETTFDRIRSGDRSVDIKDAFNVFKKLSSLCLRRNAISNTAYPLTFALPA